MSIHDILTSYQAWNFLLRSSSRIIPKAIFMLYFTISSLTMSSRQTATLSTAIQPVHVQVAKSFASVTFLPMSHSWKPALPSYAAATKMEISFCSFTAITAMSQSISESSSLTSSRLFNCPTIFRSLSQQIMSKSTTMPSTSCLPTTLKR